MVIKMKKRILSLALAIVMVLSLCTVAAAANDEQQAVTDTNAATVLLKELGIIKGYEDDQIHAERSVTRAQMAKILVLTRGQQNEIPVGSSAFTDAKGHWAEGYIALANDLGIIQGKGGGVFDPDASVTETEAGAMMLRTLGYGNITGTDWKQAVAETSLKTETLKDIKVGDAAATRGDIIGSTYQMLFTPTVEKATGSDGTVVYNATEQTLAQNLDVAVIPVGDNSAAFAINGKLIGSSYPISLEENIPKANTAPSSTSGSTDAVHGFVLGYDSSSKEVATLIPSLDRTTIAYLKYGAELAGSMASHIFEYGCFKKSADKNGAWAYNIFQQETGNITVVDELPERGSCFVQDTKDSSKWLNFNGKSAMPVTPTGNTKIYKVTDESGGYCCVVVPVTSENTATDTYTGGAQVFMVNPKSYSEAVLSADETYYSAEGTVNKVIKDVKLDSDTGAAFFKADDLKPGIYKNVYYDKGLICNMGSGKPVNELWESIYPSDTPSDPLVGFKYESGVFQFGTKTAEGFNYRLDGQTLALIASEPEAMAFCFHIDSSGNVTGEIKKISELVSDDDAFVWGTLDKQNGGTMIANLYIVYSDNASWNAQFAAILD